MSILDAAEPPERPDFRRIGRYKNPHVIDLHGNRVQYRRSSSAGKILDDETGLVDWRILTILSGCAQRPDLMAEVSTLDPNTNKNELRDISEKCLEAGKGTQRSTTGKAIHSMLDHVDLGHDWEPAPQFKAAVDAYVRMLDVYGLIPIDVEVQCVNDTYRVAGTADRRYRTTRQLLAPTGEIIPIGSVVVGDTKTGKSLEYASGTYATQLAAYADSVRYDVLTDERTPFDPPTFREWGVVVHVVADDGRCDLYFVDLEAGRNGLALSNQVREWRARTDLITPARPPLATPYLVDVSTVPAEAPTTPVAARTGDDGTSGADDPPPTMTGAVRAWLRERINVIRAHSELATAMLQRKWPEGVPGLKYDTQTLEQLDAIATAVDAVEREFTLPFPSRDPRVNREERSIVERWSKPTGDDRPHDPEEIIAFHDAIEKHPRRDLVAQWVASIPDDGKDRWALLHALYEFALMPTFEWEDADATVMLDGTLRALGYNDGIDAIADVRETDAPKIMAAAFAITAGTAMVLYGEDGKPVVRIIRQ